MFGHSQLGTYAFGESPPLRTTFALIARVVIVPAIRARKSAAATVAAVMRFRPK